MKEFLVYRSSAGSGKTYTLVKTYLALLFKNPNDYGFKQILAITFTNKAADEMKNRVFEALEKITKEGVSNELAIQIATENNFLIEEICSRSESIYQKILHNYGDFSLMTIDKFTNQVIGAFSKELGLSNQYDVILEEQEFLEETISEYVDDASRNTFQFKLIQDMIDESINQGYHNDIEKQLAKLKQIIFETQKDNIGFFNEEDILRLRSHIVEQLKSTRSQLCEMAEKGVRIINEHGIDSNWLSYGRLLKVFSVMDQLPHINSDIIDKWKDWSFNDQWFKKSLKKADLEIINPVRNQLDQTVNEIILLAFKWLRNIELHKMITPYSMIQSLLKKVEEKKVQLNSILISDFNFLISDIIQKEPAGFIFERIGSRYHYILVDEFQDTSTLQWNNLIPLIHESLASGGSNLVVGDAKQAIYRWRNGNVNQFIDLPLISEDKLKNNYQALLRESYDDKELNDNWRSSLQVVSFNNWLFSMLPEKIGLDEIKNAYKNSNQNIKRNFDGYVNVKLKSKDDFDITKYLESTISELINIGYCFRDITLLTRSKNDGSKIIRSLQALRIPFTSEDSVLLVNSIIYKILFFGLDFFSYNGFNELKLLKHYLAIYFEDEPDQLGKISANISAFNKSDFSSLFAFQKIRFCVEILGLDFNDPYVETFVNIALKKIKDDYFTVGDVLDFLADNANKITVENNPTNAVQLMTIHKSKGLEFPVVIMPFGSWSDRSSLNSTYIWLNDVEIESGISTPFIGDLSKRSLASLGKREVFEKELEASTLDNVNLYYVAFTRAADQLYIAMDETKNNSSVSDKMVSLFKGHEFYDETNKEIILGNLSTVKIPSYEKKEEYINSSAKLPRIEKKPLYQELVFNEPISLGTLFHDAMSKVIYDFKLAYDYLNSNRLKGVVENTTIDLCEKYINSIQKAGSLQFLFQKGNKVYNERDIIDDSGSSFRIDRLVFTKENLLIIDYKTSQDNKPDHIEQVKNYKNIIEASGFENVKALLLYVPEMELVEVN